MLRYVALTCCVVLGVDSAVSHGQDRVYLHLPELKLGQCGAISSENPTFNYYLQVAEVLSDNEVLVKEHLGLSARSKPVYFIVEMPSKGLADDSRIELPGRWEVYRTKKIGRRTYFALRPVSSKKAGS
jgi:hypothetical protein